MDRRYPLALLLGLALASVPIVASRGDCVASIAPADAPRYLLLASDEVARDLACGAAGEAVHLVRVVSTDEASAQIADESIAGIVFDRSAYEATPGGVPGQWLRAGDGRVLAGIDVTHWEIELRLSAPPRTASELTAAQRGETADLQPHHLGRVHADGASGGSGTVALRGPSAIARLLVAMDR
ncbi:MAG: hypothetical protein WD734_04800 [Dehalococcoidia bacterium]